jgi:hypothetical protein
MSTDRKTASLKQQPETPDSLTKSSKKIDVELTNEELKRANGGSRPIIVVC